MPELPEVETVRRQLKKLVLNKLIVGVTSNYDKVFNGDIKELEEVLVNNEIIDVERYGKYLVFILKDNHVLISHLRMEGKYFVRNESDEVNKHEHIIFHFNNNQNLRYHDTRKFGRMDLRTKDNYLKIDPLHKLGSEPEFMKDGELYNLLNKKNVFIKVALLDQTIIAGLGNIYVDEVLFLSKIHPNRRTNEITLKEANFITKNAKLVLDKATKLGGTTIKSFSVGEVDGLFQNELLIHTKVGEPCPVCSSEIIKIKVGGRGTYVCNNCQK